MDVKCGDSEEEMMMSEVGWVMSGVMTGVIVDDD